MYTMHTLSDTVRVPPTEFGGQLKKSILGLLQEEYEGLVDEDLGVVVSVNSVNEVGSGKVIPGDGGAYYKADFKALFYKPEVQEIVEGSVSEITEFGAFVRIGPIEGLVHVSQILDDYINHDAKSKSFVGKKTNRKISAEDTVTARVVTVSLKGTISSSKIGLTMRQPFLGKDEWIFSDEKQAKKPSAESKGKAKEEKKDKKADSEKKDKTDKKEKEGKK